MFSISLLFDLFLLRFFLCFCYYLIIKSFLIRYSVDGINLFPAEITFRGLFPDIKSTFIANSSMTTIHEDRIWLSVEAY